MANGVKEFLDDIRSAEFPEFRAEPFYERQTDSLMFYVRNVRSKRKRVNDLLTLYLAIEDDTLVGCEVKGVIRILRQLKSLSARGFVVLHDHKINLAVLLAFALTPVPDDPRIEEKYKPALDELSDVDFDCNELTLAGAC